MQKLIIIICLTFLLISGTNEMERIDFKSALNERVIGVGPFTMEKDYCKMEDSVFTGWFIFPTDSTFLFYNRISFQHKLSKGYYKIEKNKIVFHFSSEIAITQIRNYADVPTPIEEVIQTIQDEYERIYWLKWCGNRIMLEDENGEDYGIQVRKSYEEMVELLELKRLEIKSAPRED